MSFRKKRSQPSDDERLLKELRSMIYQKGKNCLSWLQTDVGRNLPSARPEDLLVLSLLAQDLYNRALEKLARSSTRLAIVLTVLTAFLVIVAGVDIALRMIQN